MGYPIFAPQVRWGTPFLVDFWSQFGTNLAPSWATLVQELILDGLVGLREAQRIHFCYENLAHGACRTEAPKSCPETFETSMLKDFHKIVGRLWIDLFTFFLHQNTQPPLVAQTRPRAAQNLRCLDFAKKRPKTLIYTCDDSCNARPPCSRSAGAILRASLHACLAPC